MPSVNLAGLNPISIAIGTAIRMPAIGQRNTCSAEQSGNLSVKVLHMVGQGLGNHKEQKTGQTQAFRGKVVLSEVAGVGSVHYHIMSHHQAANEHRWQTFICCMWGRK